MRFVLLLGAGFSRNWGGWLATEVFEYLLGSFPDAPDLQALLWQTKDKGGFEGALSKLQDEARNGQKPVPRERLARFERALGEMFEVMNRSLARVSFEPCNSGEYQVSTFLRRFDAIFTLNQDLLLERHYRDVDNFHVSGKWHGCQFPGLRPEITDGISSLDKYRTLWRVQPEKFEIRTGLQPIFKLHGSTNWVSEDAAGILVMGGEKASSIKAHPILDWYHREFEDQLLMPETRLMVIGYGFRDDHVNEIIGKGAKIGSLKVFVLDPAGVDVMNDDQSKASISYVTPFADALRPSVIGSSRRGIKEIFQPESVEFGKVMRFFA